jgi:hypothetical protein
MTALGQGEFRIAAAELGLEFFEGANAGFLERIGIAGVVGGQRMSIRQWRGDFVWVEFDAFFDPPSDLHLYIDREGVASKVSALFGKHDIQVGNPEIDKAFCIKAHEKERARGLFTQEVCAALLPWKNAGDLFHIDDEGVHLAIRPGSYSTLDGESIVKNAQATAYLASVIARALPSVPPSHILAEHVETWREFASAHGLEFLASPLRVSGSLTDARYRTASSIPFAARVAPVSKDGYGVDLRVRIEPQLPCYLRVRPAHWYDVFEKTGDAAHEKTGDPAFDDALRVTTDDPDAARKILGPGVRNDLLTLLHQHGAVSLENGELAIRTKTMVPPDHFATIAEETASVAREIANAAGA